MNKAKVMRKAEAGEGLTVAEIKVYQKAVKPERHVYGKYGTLAKLYLEDKGIDWPHDQVLYSTHWEDCKESFSVEHVQP